MGTKMIFHIAYITNGKRNDFIKLSVSAFEKIVDSEDELKFYFVGNLQGDTELMNKGKYQHFVEKDHQGWITRKKNIAKDLIKEFSNSEDIVLILADDVAPTKKVLENLKKHVANGVEIVAPKIIKNLKHPNLRTFDWCSIGGDKGHTLLCFDDIDDHAYIDGSTMIVKAAVLDKVVWNEDLFINQMEDVELSRRLIKNAIIRGAKDVVFYGPYQNWPRSSKPALCKNPQDCTCQ